MTHSTDAQGHTEQDRSMKINYKKDFPIFKENSKLIYLDSAATTQKPKTVIDAVTEFYTKYNSNINRGVYDLSLKAAEIYEGTRTKVANFIGAKDSSEIIFTGNATESINLVVLGYAKKNLKKGDIVVLSEMEHNSNVVPWILLKKELGIKIFYLPINEDFRLNYQTFLQENLDFNKVKFISLTHASNVLGTVNPLEEIIPMLKKKCKNAKFLIDATQSVAHKKLNVRKLSSDFLVFSAHKMYGPSGVGVLWIKQELLDKIEPIFSGSHMVENVTKEKVDFALPPEKFEAGTGKLEGVYGLGAAIDYIDSVGYKNIALWDRELTEYGINTLFDIEGIKIYGSKNSKDRLPIFTFNVLGIHPHDVSEILNRNNICVRTGHHCAQVLFQTLNVPSALRASFSIYNSKDDTDKLIKGIRKTKRIFKI